MEMRPDELVPGVDYEPPSDAAIDAAVERFTANADALLGGAPLGEPTATEQPLAEPSDATVRVLKQGGFVILILGGKGHRLLKRDARKLGGLLQKAGLS